MKKIVLLFVAAMVSAAMQSQDFNGYKFASVPQRFSFLKEKDKEKNKYNLNTLSKLYMQKYGFETYIEGDTAAPFDFINNNCNKVYVDLQTYSTMFVTKIKVLLKDCNGKILYTSAEGRSNEKVVHVAYNEALRMAFNSMASIRHEYNGSQPVQNTVTTDPTQQPLKGETVVSSTEILYAQPIQNGFQLVNSEPKVVYKIYKTSNSDIYAAVKGNISGVFIPKGNEWFFEYYQNDQLVSEKVNVKF